MRLLLAADTMLGSHLVERELERQQRRIEHLVAQLDHVNQDIAALAEKLAFSRAVLCLLELRARSERDDLDDWLCFAPEIDGEESLLDNVIACLVKTGLADIDAQPCDTGGYLYRIDPDWPVIIARVQERSVAAELMSWLEEQL
jgi:hypothetical protein